MASKKENELMPVPPYTAEWKEYKLYQKPAGWASLYALVVAFGVEVEDLEVNSSSFAHTAYTELSKWSDVLYDLALLLSNEQADNKLKRAREELFTPQRFISKRNQETGVDLARMPLGKLKVAVVAEILLERLHFALNKIFSVRWRFGEDADIDQLLFEKQYQDDMPSADEIDFRFSDGQRLSWPEYSEWVKGLVKCYKGMQGMPLAVHEAFSKAKEVAQKEMETTRPAGQTGKGFSKTTTSGKKEGSKTIGPKYDKSKDAKPMPSQWKQVTPVNRDTDKDPKEEKKVKSKEVDEEGFEKVKAKKGKGKKVTEPEPEKEKEEEETAPTKKKKQEDKPEKEDEEEEDE
ncbi:MAG: hypothetical protein Edafosvirus22_11 [Edafosvirus sp.]|uniref:Uncharacterized protein n=1 Tax=Edafosvirus sp. TaxID=2487765 RepID=A0A3G4ZWC3_9VIRU|nr:MAG: hypothetical protein Edafosvirus22_11 [Edafosvirus sp.]